MRAIWWDDPCGTPISICVCWVKGHHPKHLYLAIRYTLDYYILKYTDKQEGHC